MTAADKLSLTNLTSDLLLTVGADVFYAHDPETNPIAMVSPTLHRVAIALRLLA